MAQNSQEKVIAFDTLFTNNHIRMLKVLLTYVEPPRQSALAVYIKVLELQYTLSFYKKHPTAFCADFPHEDFCNTSRLCDELLPLCSPSEQEKVNRAKNMVQNFTNMQEMMQMMQMMKEIFPEGAGNGENMGDILSGLSGMPGMPDLSGFDFSGMDLSQLF